MSAGLDFQSVFETLLEQHGAQQWWPADTTFEIMVGAILTQNTAWSNVEKAIHNLKQANVLSLQALVDAPLAQLGEWIRPSGYYNLKAKRLQAFCSWLAGKGGIEALEHVETDALRSELLSVYGVGPETADDMLLYALHRPVFVIDAYTRRIFSRLELVNGDEKYDELRLLFEGELRGDTGLYSEYHALIVMHGKDICRKSPLCTDCHLRSRCRVVEAGRIE